MSDNVDHANILVLLAKVERLEADREALQKAMAAQGVALHQRINELERRERNRVWALLGGCAALILSGLAWFMNNFITFNVKS